MNKKTILILNIAVIATWTLTGITNFISDDISKFSYGCVWFTLIMTWTFKAYYDFHERK